ncbi:hypothetical protein [Streptomyces sp. NPDC054794]
MEAVQTSVMAVRLIMAVADAVRRNAERRAKGAESVPPPVEQAVPAAQEALQRLFPSDIAAALMQGADWPQMAQQLMALQQAGVDLF